jgi:DNA polymerase-3 subunit delta'
LPPPRSNPELLGQEAAEQELIGAFTAGRPAHAWIFTGPRGIGKATLAFRLARWLLAGEAEAAAKPGLFGAGAPPNTLAVAGSHPVFQRIAAGGHADLLTIQRALNDRGELKKDIAVDDARKIEPFLRLTAAEGGWRIVILDEAEALNRSSANALLKILEEPPRNTLLVLVCENAGALLPTIRSRCRLLTLQPLPEKAMRALLARAAPDVPAADLGELLALAQGSIGRALSLIEADGLRLHRQVQQILARVPGLAPAEAVAAGEALGRAGSDASYRLFTSMLLDQVAGLARRRALEGGSDGGPLPRLHAAALLDLWSDLDRRFREADQGNLDKRQVVMAALMALDQAARA